MTSPRILIACIGNVFLGDDGFGPEVARRLATRTLPPHVILRNFGIRGVDLTHALMDPCELVIFVDACPLGSDPGTVYLIEPDPSEWNMADGAPVHLELHNTNPMSVLRAVRSMGGTPGRILIVGCEPVELETQGESDEGKLGLSYPVELAVDEAIALIEELIEKVPAAELAEPTPV